MRIARALALVGAMVLAGCAGGSTTQSKFRAYDGPEVTRILVLKEERVMQLLHHDRVLESYAFELGFAPLGDKSVEGDGRTPEGRYKIDRRNPNSRFHLSLGIDYPSAKDFEEARALGESPGGDIFIHGTPKRFGGTEDWTWGCIAVTDREMEDIYAMVEDGTTVDIYASARQMEIAPLTEASWGGPRVLPSEMDGHRMDMRPRPRPADLGESAALEP